MTGYEIAAALKTTNDITKDHQKWIFNYVMVSWFWPHYLKYLTKSIVIEWISKAEAEKQIALFQENPHPAMAFIQSEAEIEYRNMFGVLEKTIPLIDEADNEQKEIDPDKMKRLKDLSKEFNSTDMQGVIAWILAGEYNQPWSFSLRTMDIVKHLSKEEVNLFRKFLGLVFLGNSLPESFFNDSENFIKSWLSYGELLELENLWLISWKSSARKIWINSDEELLIKITIGWTSQIFKYKWEKRLDGIFLLTKSWSEIATLLDPIFNQVCFDFVCKYLEWLGFIKFPVI